MRDCCGRGVDLYCYKTDKVPNGVLHRDRGTLALRVPLSKVSVVQGGKHRDLLLLDLERGGEGDDIGGLRIESKLLLLKVMLLTPRFFVLVRSSVLW